MSEAEVRFPKIQNVEHHSELHATCRVEVPKDLVFFEGHFPDNPIMPGVAQIQWAGHYAKTCLPIPGDIIGMEVIKFKNVIMPGDILSLDLSYRPDRAKLTFKIGDGEQVFSSGRLVYSEQEA